MIIIFILVIGVLCFSYAYYIEPYFIEVKYITIYTDKLKEESLRVVHISDLHCETRKRNEDKLKDIINPLSPDLIVFTGDSLNESVALDIFKETMSHLNAKIGKYAVKGNHDVWYYSNLDLFSGTGFTELDSHVLSLEKSSEKITISGLRFGAEWELNEISTKVGTDTFNIFLYHTPDLIEEEAMRGMDLYLAGHTHGGQVRVPIYGAIVTFSKFGKRYEMGKYKFIDTILYVNRGIGMEGDKAPRVRFLARPEITVIDIKPKSS